MSGDKPTITQLRKLTRIGGSVTIAIPPEARKLLGWNVSNQIRLVAGNGMLIMIREKEFQTDWRKVKQ